MSSSDSSPAVPLSVSVSVPESASASLPSPPAALSSPSLSLSFPRPLLSLAEVPPGRCFARHTRPPPDAPTLSAISSQLVTCPVSLFAAERRVKRAREILQRLAEDSDDSWDSGDSSGEGEKDSSSDEEEEAECLSGGASSRSGKQRSGSGRPSAAPVSLARDAAAAFFSNQSLSSFTSSQRAARLKMCDLLSPLLGPRLAPLVERALFLRHNSDIGAAYSKHARVLVSALRVLHAADTNAPLLAQLRDGLLSPSALVNMSNAQLAPTALQQERQSTAAEELRMRQREKEAEESVVTARERQRESEDQKRLDTAIISADKEASPLPPLPQPPGDSAPSKSISIAVPTTPTSTSLPSTPTTPSRPLLSRGTSEAEEIIQRFAAESLGHSTSSSRSPRSPSAAAAARSQRSPATSATNSPQTTSQRPLSLKRKGSTDSLSSSVAAAAADGDKRRRVSSPTPPSLERVGSGSSLPHPSIDPTHPSTPPSGHEKGRRPPPPQQHPSDPIRLAVRDELAATAPAAWTGRLAFAIPRRGELSLRFDPLPARDVFGPAGTLQPTLAQSSPSDVDCLLELLPFELVDGERMKAQKIDGYIRYKADHHLSTSAAHPCERYFPLSLHVGNCEPLLSQLFVDFSHFFTSHHLALAFNFEQDSIPSDRHCALWIVPPRCLGFLTDGTAREVLQWNRAPRSDEWWGVLWVKKEGWKLVQRAAADRRRQVEHSLDVPSDDDERDRDMDADGKGGNAKSKAEAESSVHSTSVGPRDPRLGRSSSPPVATALAGAGAAAAASHAASASAPSAAHDLMRRLTAPSVAGAGTDYLSSLLNKIAGNTATTVPQPMQTPMQHHAQCGIL